MHLSASVGFRDRGQVGFILSQWLMNQEAVGRKI